nr:MAG TPA: hypothetical protein [Caudoviricetes sp.]
MLSLHYPNAVRYWACLMPNGLWGGASVPPFSFAPSA